MAHDEQCCTDPDQGELFCVMHALPQAVAYILYGI